MRRFVAATSGWPVGAIASVLLTVALLAGPTAAASLNHNLTATAKYSTSSYWDSDQNSTTFIADRAFDGDLSTRWNGYTGTGEGEWLAAQWRSEEHTSELQSQSNLVCRLLLEKKKNK